MQSGEILVVRPRNVKISKISHCLFLILEKNRFFSTKIVLEKQLELQLFLVYKKSEKSTESTVKATDLWITPTVIYLDKLVTIVQFMRNGAFHLA